MAQRIRVDSGFRYFILEGYRFILQSLNCPRVPDYAHLYACQWQAKFREVQKWLYGDRSFLPRGGNAYHLSLANYLLHDRRFLVKRQVTDEPVNLDGCHGRAARRIKA
ncbi:hypothetical protein BC937DRAFT_94853 [Endogone sp. FLAS-F59071]|nr:hypothetical protein BC937DRAFT_94853 [Endogone sp. FLAS-F59071]|eukprot:RUS20601.1 hypothetical protein BC937DRAFT_94853 [Endogone sp. FLAS-F59071]